MNSLFHRSLLKLSDCTASEVNFFLELASSLKDDSIKNKEKKLLQGKKLALIFEKSSTRTRCSFEVAAHDQGANTTYLSQRDIHLGIKESVEDTVKILSKLYDGI